MTVPPSVGVTTAEPPELAEAPELADAPELARAVAEELRAPEPAEPVPVEDATPPLLLDDEAPEPEVAADELPAVELLAEDALDEDDELAGDPVVALEAEPPVPPEQPTKSEATNETNSPAYRVLSIFHPPQFPQTAYRASRWSMQVRRMATDGIRLNRARFERGAVRVRQRNTSR
jgi:hypothetical protein